MRSGHRLFRINLLYINEFFAEEVSQGLCCGVVVVLWCCGGGVVVVVCCVMALLKLSCACKRTE